MWKAGHFFRVLFLSSISRTYELRKAILFLSLFFVILFSVPIAAGDAIAVRRETTDVRYDEMGEKAQESDYGIKTNFVGDPSAALSALKTSPRIVRKTVASYI